MGRRRVPLLLAATALVALGLVPAAAAQKEAPPPEQPAPARGMPILGPAKATHAQAARWARARGATPRFVALARLYWYLAPRRGGVRPEVAYAQAAKETAYGRFGGVIDASYRNPCGLKTTAGGGNYDPKAHQRFPTWRVGVRAHLDHLALYAGAAGYPRAKTPDPRHFPFLAGKARTVQALGGKWAPSPTYGSDVAARTRTLVRTP